MSSLVSVMMPCFNSARTLPWALASLVAQTYTDWECLLIDDGSTDRPLDVVDWLGDPRIRVIRLERNMGRGVARQVALDHARGELLCMLDADDWVFPTKIEHQVEAMTAESGLGLVSTGLAIVDAQNRLVGIRAQGPVGPLRSVGPMTRLAAPWLPFAASMMRMNLARQVRFDGGLPASEDLDFLLNLILNSQYAILPEASYIYTEHASITLDKMVLSLRLAREVFLKHRDRFPLGSRLNAGRTILKEVIYRAGFTLGWGEHLVRRRSLPPATCDVRQFEEARRIVGERVAHLFLERETRDGLTTRYPRAVGSGCDEASQ
jgi:hypothetical protein